MTPEDKAREVIDRKLEEAGWVIQDKGRLNLSASRGVIVRELHTDTGPGDYIVFLDRNPVGVIEAKKDEAGQNITVVEEQSGRYASSKLPGIKSEKPLRFRFEATGQIIRFTDNEDPFPRSREIFHFFRPEQLAEWLAETSTLRSRLRSGLPPIRPDGLRDCQFVAAEALERSFAANKPRALVSMATGAGKTFLANTSVYRLIKYAGAKRILFLVDTRNLGKQANQEFAAYTPPDDPRKFPELYNLQRLTGGTIDPSAKVCISTIQRMYSMLSGAPLDESLEDTPLSEMSGAIPLPRQVRYNPAIPVETFDFIIIDECHRSIYNVWKQVLDYFDAFLIGLTATPDKRTYGFFNENVVSEYTYEQSVIDGVNVGYDVYLIETEISQKGGKIEAREWVDHRDRETRKKRWAETEEETVYEGKELDRSVVNPSQIRQVIEAMKRAVETEIYPTREETPKTLIFAKTDSHADDIIRIVREVYGQGNAFCKKVTYKAEEDPDSVLSSFRNDFYPRIAVTVDMIATGTDVKALEVLLFMRDVRSKSYYEQMKGRGVRSLDADGLKRVSGSAEGPKTRFVLIDAVGVEKSLKTQSRPLEKKPGVPLKSLLEAVALGQPDNDTLLSLANRLIRLNKQLDQKAQRQIEKISKGIPVAELAKAVANSVDPDLIVSTALETAAKNGLERTEDTLLPSEIEAARDQRVRAACAPFDDPDLRDALDGARRDIEQIIDHVNLDRVTFAGFKDAQEEQAGDILKTFSDYLESQKDKDEIAGLAFFYQQPFQRRGLTFEMIEDLHDHLSRPPLMLTTDKLWEAYARVNGSKVKGAGRARQLTDLVSLVRFALGIDPELKPFADEVDRRFQAWVFRHNAQRSTSFTPEQMDWLRLMKDHISSSYCIARDDLELPGMAEKGGLQKAWALFGKELDVLIDEMNQKLVA